MGSNVVGEHAPIRSASLVNAIQVYAVLRQNFVKESFSEDSVVVAGGEVTGVEWVTELAGVITGDLSPVLPVCVTHVAKRSLGLGNVETAPAPLFTNIAHPLWSDQEKATFFIFISYSIEHAVLLMSNHVLRPSRVVN